jgi:hypothetical protein
MPKAKRAIKNKSCLRVVIGIIGQSLGLLDFSVAFHNFPALAAEHFPGAWAGTIFPILQIVW